MSAKFEVYREVKDASGRCSFCADMSLDACFTCGVIACARHLFHKGGDARTYKFGEGECSHCVLGIAPKIEKANPAAIAAADDKPDAADDDKPAAAGDDKPDADDDKSVADDDEPATQIVDVDEPPQKKQKKKKRGDPSPRKQAMLAKLIQEGHLPDDFKFDPTRVRGMPTRSVQGTPARQTRSRTHADPPPSSPKKSPAKKRRRGGAR